MSQTPLLGTVAVSPLPATAMTIGVVPPSPLTSTDLQGLVDELQAEITASSGLVFEDEGTPLSTNGTTLNVVGAGATVSGTGTTKTLTVPGGATASDAGIWRPLLDSATGAIIVDGTTGEATMGFGPA